MPSREVLLQLLHGLAHVGGQLQRVRIRGPGRSGWRRRSCCRAGCACRRPGRPARRARHPPGAPAAPSAPVLTMMSRNCSSSLRRPAALSAIWNSVPFEGGAPSWPAATCTFCSRIARDDVACGEIARGELLRIEPDPHRVVAAAEDLHVAHARQACQHVLDVQHRVVAQVECVVAAVWARSGCTTMVRLEELLTVVTPRSRTSSRQARQRLGDAVLHLHLGAVDIGAERKVTVSVSVPSMVDGRGHVEHVLDADDGLLQRRGHRVRDHLGIGARIGGSARRPRAARPPGTR